MIINGISRTIPIVDSKGCPTQLTQILVEQIRQLPMIIGSGSPEGIEPAMQGRLYFDTAGVAGSRLYIKTVDAITNDSTLGWEIP